MAVEDINKRVRAMSEKQVEKGQEMQEVQKSQSELLNINNERRNNLNTARVESAMEAENNQNLAQAATLMAAGVGGGMAVSQQVQGFNPQTQALLSKYGVGKPQQNTVTSRNSQVTPQKVTINNTTTTNTTNNVQVSQPNIPISQPQIALKQQANQGESKIKAWLSGVFARQNERAALREKEYQKRESTLTRSANKMMRRMEEVGKTFAERLDPRRIGNVFGDQIKTLMFLFGFGMLSKNWDKVLGFVSKAEEFYNWVKGDKDGFFDGLSARLTKFIGGKDGETLSQAFTGLFGDLKSRITDAFKNFGADISDKFQAFMESRADAVKAIPLPKLDLKNIATSLNQLITYLGDVITAAFGGAQAVAKRAVSHAVENKAAERGLVDSSKTLGGKRYYDNIESNTSYGDAALVVGDSKGKTYKTLLGNALDEKGDLRERAGASISQSRDITQSLNSAFDHGIINTAAVSGGLSRLNRAVKRSKDKFVPVDELFLDRILGPEKVDELEKSGILKPEQYVLVKREKTLSEKKGNENPLMAYMIENAKTTLTDKYVGEGITGGAARTIVSGDDVTTGAGIGETIIRSLPGGDTLADGSRAVSEWIEGIMDDDYTYDLVPATKENLEKARKSLGKPDKYTFYKLTPEVLDKIGQEISGTEEGLSFDSGDKNYLESIQNYLESLAKKNNIDPSKVKVMSVDGKPSSNYDIDLYKTTQSFSEIEEYEKDKEKTLKKKSEKRWKEYEEKHKRDRVGKTVDNTVELAKDAKDFVVEEYKNLKTKIIPQTSAKSMNPSGDQKKFVIEMLPAYQKVLVEKGFNSKFAPLLIAQDALESGWGKSTSGDYNFGGIKVPKKDQGKGLGRQCSTTEYYNGIKTSIVDEFRNFSSPEDYANYHVDLLSRDRYKTFNVDTIPEAIWRIKAGGYATDPNYVDSLSKVVASVDNVIANLDIENHDTLPDEVPTTNESEVLLADAKSSTPDSTIPTIPTESKVIIGKDGYEYSVAPDYEESIIEPTYSTPITSAKPIYADNNFNSSPEKVTPKVTTKTSDTDLLATVNNISETLDQQTVALQNLAIGVTALADVAVNTRGTTINYGGGNISRDPSYISVPGQNIV